MITSPSIRPTPPRARVALPVLASVRTWSASWVHLCSHLGGGRHLLICSASSFAWQKNSYSKHVYISSAIVWTSPHKTVASVALRCAALFKSVQITRSLSSLHVRLSGKQRRTPGEKNLWQGRTVPLTHQFHWSPYLRRSTNARQERVQPVLICCALQTLLMDYKAPQGWRFWRSTILARPQTIAWSHYATGCTWSSHA